MPRSRARLSIRSGLSIVAADALEGRSDAVGCAAEGRQMAESIALGAHQQPVDDLPRNQGHQDSRFGSGFHEPDEPHRGVQQARIQRAHVDRLRTGLPARRRKAGFDHDGADEGGIQIESKAEVGPLLRGIADLDHDGQLDRREQVMRRVVPEVVLAEVDLLAALGDDAKGWDRHAVNGLRGRRYAMNVHAPQRLYRPVFTGHPRQPLDQFFPMGLCLTLLAAPAVRRSLLPCFPGPSMQLDPARASRRVSDNHPGELSHESSLCERAYFKY